MNGRLVLPALVALTTACAPVAAEVPPPDPALVHVANTVCPEMWDWQLDIGRIMNAMSSASFREDDPSERRSLYSAAFAEALERNAQLRDQIAAWPSGPYVDRMREDVRNGLFTAAREIEDIDAIIDQLYALGQNGYHPVVSRVVIGFEKVIDVAKPELADYGDDELIRAFMTVPACQNGVKDASDGVPRFVPAS